MNDEAPLLRRLDAGHVLPGRPEPVDRATLLAAGAIVDDVKERGEPALRAHAERLDGLAPGAPLVLGGAELRRARDAMPASDVKLLERAAARILAFAQAQRACLRELDVPVPGGRAGHTIAPVERAGCYAPGGRFPLPSSVLMTAVTARAAGVKEVIVASPRPAPVTLAAAAVAGADALVPVGGAQAVAALAFGAGPVPACDVIVGPGNRWVTAAKKLVAGSVGIDMLAGPSELVVLADASADAELIAADLLAQAEHDDDAVPMLVSTDPALIDRVEAALREQLRTLPTAPTARRALGNGAAVLCGTLDEAVAVCDRLAPEHLEVQTAGAEAVARRLGHYGAVFIGPDSAEVLGDYGIGPNHVLPTGRSARFVGGLSVLSFLRVRTWLECGKGATAPDAAALARLEGLEAHARSAERRLPGAG